MSSQRARVEESGDYSSPLSQDTGVSSKDIIIISPGRRVKRRASTTLITVTTWMRHKRRYCYDGLRAAVEDCVIILETAHKTDEQTLRPCGPLRRERDNR